MNYLIALIGLALLLTGCKGDISKLNDDNPNYRKGIQLTEESRYDEAVRAFQECLRYSPKSHKAHLQLAILYEDNLMDLPQAIAHYELYITGEPDAEKRQKARIFKERAEEAYYLQLHQRFSNLTMPAQTTPAHSPAGRPASRPSGGTIALPDPAPEPVPPVAPSPSASVPTPPAPAPARTDVPPVVQPEPEAPVRTYTVQSGDNLSKIARKFYGSTVRWREIYEANRDTLPSPDQLKVGQELVIPE